jgi:arginine decarboxylase
MNIYVAPGIGEGPTKLAAFDAALNNAGIANCNLIRLSSVIPPETNIVDLDSGVPEGAVPSVWGDRLYVVYAEQRVDTPGEKAWAGIGWVQDEATKKGLFVEHEGLDEQSVREDIVKSLGALMTTRGVDFGEIKMKVAGIECVDQPVCAMVIAAYQASDWNDTPRSAK